MGKKVDEAAYEEMIGALQSFASKISTIADGLQATSAACQSALESDDKAIPALCEKVNTAGVKYGECADTARSIASTMADELAESKREDDVWNGDE